VPTARQVLHDHASMCPVLRRPCPNRCGASFDAAELRRHIPQCEHAEPPAAPPTTPLTLPSRAAPLDLDAVRCGGAWFADRMGPRRRAATVSEATTGHDTHTAAVHRCGNGGCDHEARTLREWQDHASACDRGEFLCPMAGTAGHMCMPLFRSKADVETHLATARMSLDDICAAADRAGTRGIAEEMKMMTANNNGARRY
jgi:hypothetical protein